MIDLLSRILPGKKTYIVVVAGLVTIGLQFFVGDIDVNTLVNQVVLLLGLGGIRMGVK